MAKKLVVRAYQMAQVMSPIISPVTSRLLIARRANARAFPIIGCRGVIIRSFLARPAYGLINCEQEKVIAIGPFAQTDSQGHDSKR